MNSTHTGSPRNRSRSPEAAQAAAWCFRAEVVLYTSAWALGLHIALSRLLGSL